MNRMNSAPYPVELQIGQHLAFGTLEFAISQIANCRYYNTKQPLKPSKV